MGLQLRVAWSEVKIAQWCPTLCDPMDYIFHGILQVRILEWVVFPFFMGSSQPRDRTQVSLIAGGFFTSWATGKPKNTWVGSLSLLQWIFPTEELNQGLLHCRRILYQLNYQGSPYQYIQFNSVQFSSSVMSNYLRPHGLQHARLPCLSPTLSVIIWGCWYFSQPSWFQLVSHPAQHFA